MRSVSHVTRACSIFALVGVLPLLAVGCMHQSGCRGCRAASTPAASFDRPASTTAGQSNPVPAATATAGASQKRQTTCPVTGQKLGSMGPPVPVSVKGETIYVCCKGCVDAVRADPDKYLEIVRSGDGERIQRNDSR